MKKNILQQLSCHKAKENGEKQLEIASLCFRKLFLVTWKLVPRFLLISACIPTCRRRTRNCRVKRRFLSRKREERGNGRVVKNCSPLGKYFRGSCPRLAIRHLPTNFGCNHSYRPSRFHIFPFPCSLQRQTTHTRTCTPRHRHIHTRVYTRAHTYVT